MILFKHKTEEAERAYDEIFRCVKIARKFLVVYDKSSNKHLILLTGEEVEAFDFDPKIHEKIIVSEE